MKKPVSPCDGCQSPNRRAFLLTSAAALVALTPLGATAGEARYAIPAADGASIDMGRQVILVRDNGAHLRLRPVVPAREHGAAVAGQGQALPVPAARVEVHA